MPDLNVTILLLESMAVPVLMYAIEALKLTESELNSLDYTLQRALCKVFRVANSSNLQYCADIYGINSISNRYTKKKDTFLWNIKSSQIIFCYTAFCKRHEMYALLLSYACNACVYISVFFVLVVVRARYYLYFVFRASMHFRFIFFFSGGARSVPVLQSAVHYFLFVYTCSVCIYFLLLLFA